MKYRPVAVEGEMRRRSFASEGRFGEAEPEGRASVRAGGSGVESRSLKSKVEQRRDKIPLFTFT